MTEITLTDSFNDEMAVIIDAEGSAETYVECGNCCGTASSKISHEELIKLRDFLNEHVK